MDDVTAERIGRNDSIFRDANERIRDAAAEHDLADEMAVPFLCECADPSCNEIVRVTLKEYAFVRADPVRFVNAEGHQVAAQGAARVVAESDGHVVVEKTGRAAEVAEELADEGSGLAAPRGDR